LETQCGWLQTLNDKENKQMVISVMLAVANAPTACAWYKKALGATELWNFGAVIGLEIAGNAFFLGEPANNGWESPNKLGMTTTRVEVFCDDPDSFIAQAVQAGANGSIDIIKNHQTPWGTHRQGGFVDPFGHIWLVGDKSPLHRFPPHDK
jgi:PhnB protein